MRGSVRLERPNALMGGRKERSKTSYTNPYRIGAGNDHDIQSAGVHSD